MATKYTFSAPSSLDTWAHFLAWAGATQGISAGFTTLGFTAVTDAYAANGGTVSWANGTTNSGLSNPNVIPTTQTNSVINLFGTAFPTTSSANRAGLPTTNFKGTWSSGTAYTIGQVVTYTPASGGTQTFMCWATGGIGIAPAGAATSVNFWTPYWFEIWKMHNAGLSSADVYIKIEYGCNTTTNTWPEIAIQVGTVADGVGSILGGNYSGVEQVCDGSASNTSSFPCFMTGDGANYFGFLMWQGATGQNSCFYGLERSISGTVSSAPVYNNNYVTHIAQTNVNTVVHQNSMLVNISGANWNVNANANNVATRVLGTGCLCLPAAAQTMVVNNVSPALPVFPLVGWVGNPVTVLVGLPNTDAVEGLTITTTVYGASHSYICSKLASFNGFGNGVSGAWAVGLRYE